MKYRIFFIYSAFLAEIISASPGSRNVGENHERAHHRVARIAGGHSVKLGDRPYYAALYRKDLFIAPEPFPQCGAAILSELWLLTAYSCIYVVTNLDELSVRAGSIYYSKPSEKQQISKVAATFGHPNGTSLDGGNDIALVKLATPLEFNDHVVPIDLPIAGSVPTGYGTLTGLGGLHSAVDNKFPEVLQTVVLPIIDNVACGKLIDALQEDPDAKKDRMLDDSRFCAGPTSKNQGVCLNDAGDPLVVDEQVVGIASEGYSKHCESKNVPSIFTRVSAHLDWIDDTMWNN